MSCTTQFHFLTYNCHLFWKGLPIGPLFYDEDRRQAISRALESSQVDSVNIAALQEVWYSEFAHEINKHSKEYGAYSHWYVPEDEHHVLNPPGLMLLGDSNCTFTHAGWESYKHACGYTGWSLQDDPVFKGRIDATCQFKCSDDSLHTIGLFTTHMPVGYGTYTTQVKCSFQYLANTIQDWRAANPGCAVILLGDLNIDYFSQSLLPDGHTEYYDAVGSQGILGATAGLLDAGALAPTDPGFTINPELNTTWQVFNDLYTPPFPANQRIDYFMYANSINSSTPGVPTMSVDVTAISAIMDGLTVQEDVGGEMKVFNCSDHYPLEVSATITIND